jgi:RNA polymerase sigma-70 factor (ECF subfamily)
VNKINQNELILLIRNGNIKAFDEFYKQNWQPLYKMAYRATGSIDDAKDLVQNVFINFWNVRHSIDSTKFHISYLFTSLQNGIINQYKKDAVRRKGIEELMHFDNTPSYTNEDHYIAKEVALTLQTQVGELPPKMQRVFVLSRYEHLSISQISESLNITPRTVKNQLSNALKILRTKAEALSLIFLFIFFK